MRATYYVCYAICWLSVWSVCVIGSIGMIGAVTWGVFGLVHSLR